MFKMTLSILGLLLLLHGCSSSNEQGGNIDKQRASDANAELGLRYMLRGNYELALSKLQRSLEFDPESVNANHYMGELYRRLERFPKASSHYQTALRLDPNDSQLLNNYAAFLCGEKKIDEAIPLFNRVLENPVYRQRSQVYENMGLCMAGEKRWKEAEHYYRKALKIESEMASVLLALANLKYNLHDYFPSRAFVERYLDNHRPNPEVLWLGIRVEQALRNQQQADQYGEILLKNFASSDEAANYQKNLPQ